MGDQILMLLGDFAGDNGADAYYRARDIIDECVAVRKAIRGDRII